MKKLASVLLVAFTLLPITPAFAERNGGNGGSCDREGNCNDQRKCQGDNCRGSFSPGPFDHSPVDAFNNACLPGATCYYGQDPNNKSGGKNPPSNG